MGSTLSVPIGRVAGIPLRMSLFLPLLLVVKVVTTPGYADGEVLGFVLGTSLVFVGSILLHEFGHAFAARRDGLAVHEISIHVLGGHTTHQPAHGLGSELRVSLAGVAVNLVLALAAGAAIWATRGSIPGPPQLFGGEMWLEWIWGTNLWLAGINLLPGVPFDGGHAVEALLAPKFGRVRATVAVLSSGLLIGAALLVLGLVGQDILLSFVGGSCLMSVLAGWRSIREESTGNDAFLGVYDFSNGYTSLEKGAPKAPPRESRAAQRRREREAREEEAREAAAAREAVDSKARLDRLLDRIAAEGIASLTTEERAFLNEQSRRLRDRGRSPTRP